MVALSDHKSMLEFLELLLFIAKFPIEVIPLGMCGTPLIKGPARDFTHNIVSAIIFQVSQIHQMYRKLYLLIHPNVRNYI